MTSEISSIENKNVSEIIMFDKAGSETLHFM